MHTTRALLTFTSQIKSLANEGALTEVSIQVIAVLIQLRRPHKTVARTYTLVGTLYQCSRAVFTGASSHGSGTFRIPILFPGLRRFVYLVWRGAGRLTELIYD